MNSIASVLDEASTGHGKQEAEDNDHREQGNYHDHEEVAAAMT